MYLGHEFGELLSSFCVNKKIGTVFHRTKADMRILLSQSLYASESSTQSLSTDSALLNKIVNSVIRHLLGKHDNHDRAMKVLLDVDCFIDDWASGSEPT